MRIVSDHTDADSAKHREAEAAQRALRELAANIMRIARGAGRPRRLASQAEAFVQALSRYQATAGVPIPADQLASALDIRTASAPCDGPQEAERLFALEQTSRGSLQRAAAKLLGQLTHEQAGETQIYRGLSVVERLRAEARQTVAAQKRPAKSHAVNSAAANEKVEHEAKDAKRQAQWAQKYARAERTGHKAEMRRLIDLGYRLPTR
jgi:hypothetical protein